MVKLETLLACAALSIPLTAATASAKPSQSAVQTKREKVIIDENTILFRGEVNTESVSKTMVKMHASKQDKVTIFIDSPGGSVTDGMVLFDFIANFHKPTVCYINNAASMAFAIAQACTERYVADTTIMMQHQAFFGGQGTVGKMKEMSRFGENLVIRSNELQSKRLGMSRNDFELRVMNDWWMYGQEAVSENAADKVVFYECKPELLKSTYTETVQIFIFQVQVTWSSCPLISYPISIGANDKMKQEEADKVKKALNNRLEYMKELNGR